MTGMSFLSLASLLRNALGIPDTRILVDPAAIISYILPPVVCFFLAALLAVTPHTRAARVALWPLIVLLAIRAPLSVDLSHGWSGRGFLNIDLTIFMLTVVTRSLEWALAKGPQRRIFRPPNSSPSTFKDALDLALSFRGHGWEWSRGLYIPPETRPADRTAFVVYTSISAVAHTLVCGALQRAVLVLIPIGVGSVPEGSTIFDETLPFLARYLRSSVISTLTAFSVYSVLQQGYDMATIPAILILGQDPTEWPPLLQAPWLATSLNDFWARRWHQLFRGMFLLWSRPFTLVLGPAGTVIGAFLTSAIFHHIIMVILDNQAEFWWMLVGFGMMAPGVLAERGFYRLTGRRVGGVFGWIWTMSWLILWGNVLVEGFARAGLFSSSSPVDSMLPVRIPVERLVKEFDLWLHTI